jgi:TATA-binding protein-associated factor
VLPFLLRRLKDDVLDDLPPKIIQDIECELGPVQKQLYDDYSRSQKREELETALDGQSGAESTSTGATHHVFQELQYLRKLVNHPRLVFDPTRRKHREIEQQLAKSGGSLRDIAHAPKLTALRQLLHDCGIGVAGSSEANSLAAEAAVAQHRVLIFCQVKQMLDIIEHDLFHSHMPDVTYMRLDGGVPAEKRHGIVQTFNADPSIDVLLLTTQIGGLGLTLTGADTVIFVEHDWNPSKDLQAMDRAHRLGQKKVVNVYRLITRDTLEAKIMGCVRRAADLALHSLTTSSRSSQPAALQAQRGELGRHAAERGPREHGDGPGARPLRQRSGARRRGQGRAQRRQGHQPEGAPGGHRGGAGHGR